VGKAFVREAILIFGRRIGHRFEPPGYSGVLSFDHGAHAPSGDGSRSARLLDHLRGPSNRDPEAAAGDLHRVSVGSGRRSQLKITKARFGRRWRTS